MLRVRAFQVSIHIAGWLLFMAFPLLFINGGNVHSNEFQLLNAPQYWFFCLTYIILFYINAYLLIPQLFLKKKYVLYSISAIVLLIAVYYLQPYDKLFRSADKYRNFQPMPRFGPMRDELLGRHLPPPPPHGDRPMPSHDHPFGPLPNQSGQFGPPPSPFAMRHIDSTSLFIFVMIMALSTASRTIQQWQMTEQRAARAEADKTSAELSFLKAQINPHFLFNTLNNIYTLAVMQDAHAPESIMKLSNIMRYVTDDATEDFVPLQSELDCINDYIELQRLRLGEKTHVDLTVEGNTENKQIAPLILMTFVENIFKYGISKNKASDIVIKITTDAKSLTFFCQNRIFPEKEVTHRTGIGLANTRQRLAHLYPDKHLLSINTDDQLYTVKLLLEIA